MAVDIAESKIVRAKRRRKSLPHGAIVRSILGFDSYFGGDLLCDGRPQVNLNFGRFDADHQGVVDANIALVIASSVLPPTRDGVYRNRAFAGQVNG